MLGVFVAINVSLAGACPVTGCVGTEEPVCDPGEVISCSLSSCAYATRTCNSSGSGFGSCTCKCGGNSCTATYAWTNGACVKTYKPAGTSCADTNLCNGTETCSGSGVCTAGTPVVVTDNNPCTTDACTTTTGVVTHTAVAAGTSCSDGNVCNGAEICGASAVCNPGTPLVQDDGNPCTADACDPLTGVKHTNLADGTPCLDGNVCNGAEACSAGKCMAGTPLVLDDANACTTDSCNPVTGVRHAPVAAGSSCSDGDACNGSETCNAVGTCAAGVPPIVDDGNVCTADRCDSRTGVTHTVQTGVSCWGTVCACDATAICRAKSPFQQNLYDAVGNFTSRVVLSSGGVCP